MNFENCVYYYLICHYKHESGRYTKACAKLGRYLSDDAFNSARLKLLQKVEDIKDKRYNNYLKEKEKEKTQQAQQEADKKAQEEFEAAKKIHHENFLLLPIGTPEPKLEDFLKPQQQTKISKPLIISQQARPNPQALIVAQPGKYQPI